MQTTTDDSGTVSATSVESESVAQVEPSTLLAEPGTQLEEASLNRIQRIHLLMTFGPIWHRLSTQPLNKLIAIAIGVLMLFQMALCLTVSYVLQPTNLKGMNRHVISSYKTTIMFSYQISLISHAFGLFSVWNQWFWCAVTYVVMLLINSGYILSLLSCTVRSDCPATALFVAIPPLGKLAWAYWLVFGWMCVLIGLVAYYVTIRALVRFGCEDALSSSDGITWPEGTSSWSNSRPEEINLNPIQAAAARNNLAVIQIFPSPSKNSDSTLAMVSSLSSDNVIPSPSSQQQGPDGLQISEYKPSLESKGDHISGGPVSGHFNTILNPKYQETAV